MIAVPPAVFVAVVPAVAPAAAAVLGVVVPAELQIPHSYPSKTLRDAFFHPHYTINKSIRICLRYSLNLPFKETKRSKITK